MQGPDYTHWHGTYDLDMQFYTRMFPELEHLIDEGTHNGKGDAAQVLAAKLDEVLNSDDHKWYLDKLDHEEKSNGIRPLKVKDALRQVVI